MTALLSELGKKLAERWVTLLLMPGLLWVGVSVIAFLLRGQPPFNPGPVHDWLNGIAKTPADRHASLVVTVVAGTLIASAATGLIAGWIGRIVQHIWVTPGGRVPAKWLTAWRRHRWDTAYKAVTRAMSESVSNAAGVSATTTARIESPELARAVARCHRICPVRADRPMWIGDRLRATDIRIFQNYRLDLSVTWSRLWLMLPDSARTDLTVAYDSYASAARLFGWAFLYAALAPLWWPAAAIGVATGITAWIRARSATAVLAELSEATVDLHGAELAAKLGIALSGPLTPNTGSQVSAALRKDHTLHPDA